MPSFTLGDDITATLSHFANGAVGELEFRLVDLATGDPVIDWADTAITQETAPGDGPPWVYESTRSSVGLTAGTLQAQWRTSTAGPWIDDDEIVLSGAVASWDPPPVDDLSALIFARVTGEFGPLEVWTDTTRPTRAQGQAKIVMAQGLIAGQLPADLAVRYHAGARAIVVLQAAILTEPGYWPEDLEDYRAAVEIWQKERDAALKGLLATIKRDDDAVAEIVDGAVTSAYVTRIDAYSDEISAEDTRADGLLDGTGRVGYSTPSWVTD